MLLDNLIKITEGSRSMISLTSTRSSLQIAASEVISKPIIVQNYIEIKTRPGALKPRLNGNLEQLGEPKISFSRKQDKNASQMENSPGEQMGTLESRQVNARIEDENIVKIISNSDWKHEEESVWHISKKKDVEMTNLQKSEEKVSSQKKWEKGDSRKVITETSYSVTVKAGMQDSCERRDETLLTLEHCSSKKGKLVVKEPEWPSKNLKEESKSKDEEHSVSQTSEKYDEKEMTAKDKNNSEYNSLENSSRTGSSGALVKPKENINEMKVEAKKLIEAEKKDKETTSTKDQKVGTKAEEGWFYLRAGVSKGPVTWTKLFKKCTELDTLVWREDLTNWVPLRDLMKRSIPKEVEYYYQDHNGEQKGPVSKWYLINMSTGGEIRRDTLVWRTGMTTWCILGNLKEFEMVNDVEVLSEKEKKSCVLARKKSKTSKKCLLGSYVEITDTMHVYKDINKTSFLDPWPSCDGLSGFEVKYRAGQGYWKTKGFEVRTGLKGKVVFHWGGDKNTIRLIMIPAEDEGIYVAVKAQGLKQIESLEDTEPPAKKQRTDMASPLKTSNPIFDDAPSDGGFSSWLNNQGY